MIINENKKLRLKTKNKFCTSDIDVIVDVANQNPYTGTTATEMAQYLASKYYGAVVKYTGTTGTYTNGRLYKVIQATSNEYTFEELITPVGSITKTENGTYNVKEYAEVVVNVASGGGGIEGGYNVNFYVDGVKKNIISVTQGNALTSNPFLPVKTNYKFLGWSETENGTTITYPYTPTADTDLYAVWQNGYKATVSNLGVSSPSSVNFTKDSGFPTTFEEVTYNGDVFIKIPTMYKKVNTVVDDQITSFTIATGKIDDSYVPYPCFLDENGSLLPYVLMGKYLNNSSSTMQSVANTSPTSLAIGTARTYARNRGNGYQLYDWMFQRLWQDLIIVAMSTINTNNGSGLQTDKFGVYWGTGGIWIDGICHNSGVLAVSYKPSKYVDNVTASTDGYTSISYNLTTTTSSKQCISKLGYDPNNPFVNYPSSTVTNNSYNTYYCDYYYYSSGSHPFSSRVGDTYAHYGAFDCYVRFDWPNTYGVRLCYRPLTA